MKKRCFDIIQIGNKEDIPSRVFDYFITFVIFLNLIVTFALTFDMPKESLDYLKVIELITMIIFTIEYILRLYTSDLAYPKLGKIAAFGRFIISFDGIVCLLTILPYWMPYETIYGIAVFRIIRVFRIFHLFRVNAQSDAFHVIVSVLNEKKDQLLSSISLILILMFSASFIMYSVEHSVQPGVFDNAFSGLWWSVSTVLTVGYGDIYPITTLGKACAIVIAILGVMITAVPTGILSAGFSENYKESKLAINDLYGMKEFILKIEAGNKLIGVPFVDIKKDYGFAVYSVLRGDTQIDIKNNVVKEGDTLICKV